jgi:SET domain-containing protein
VGEYIGEVLEVEQVKSRYWNTIETITTTTTKTNAIEDREEWIHSRIHRNQGLSGDYLFDVGDDLYIDGEDTDVSNWCRFINHAEGDACNLETRCSRQIWNGNEMVPPRLWFVARRDIAPGEELLFDYGDRYWNS